MKAVNLLPQDLRNGPKGAAPAVSAGAEDAGGPGAFIVLGVLAMAVVAVAGYVLTANAVKQRQADLSQVSARASAITRQVDALKPYADFATVAQTRVKTIKDLAGSRFDWDRALADLSRALPADATLSALNATVSSDVSGATSGGGANSLRGALNVPAIELQGCTTGQTSVAKLMAHLGTVDGVTRVSLSKSDKETATPRPAKPGSAGAAAQADAGACGVGSKPAFDVVAFFEHDAAAAAGPVASSAASAPTTKAGAAAAAASASSTPPAGGAGSTTTSTTGQSK